MPLCSVLLNLYILMHAIRCPQGASYGHLEVAAHAHRQVLDEVAIRELLMGHVGHRCCWGSRPARTWTIHAVEDCNVYVGTVEIFAEERETVKEPEQYLAGEVDGKEKGPILGAWKLDLTSEFPMLFTPHKESRRTVLHSEAVDKCSGCGGGGNIVCPICNADQEPAFYKANQMSRCPDCYGRGLIAYKEGSDSMRTFLARKVQLVELHLSWTTSSTNVLPPFLLTLVFSTSSLRM